MWDNGEHDVNRLIMSFWGVIKAYLSYYKHAT